MNDTDAVLKQISGILLRSFIVAMVVLILWLAIYLVVGDYWYASQSKLFDITEHEMALFNYFGMGLFKMLAFCFFLCPYAALKMVIRFSKKQS